MSNHADCVNALLQQVQAGDQLARSHLFAALHSELHRLARREVARHGNGIAISATSLLHEAYLDLSCNGVAVFPDEARYLAYAARVMRGLVVDAIRHRDAQKRGGGFVITAFDTDLEERFAEPSEVIDVAAALDDLERLDPALAHLVDLKYFCGFSLGDIARIGGVSERTMQRRWEKARLLLHSALAASA